MRIFNSQGPFPTAREDASRPEPADNPQTRSTAYRLAFEDPDFLLRDDLRAVRLQLELLKTELSLREQGIRSTIAVFGSARVPEPEVARHKVAMAEEAARAQPGDHALARQVGIARRMLANSRYYEEARRLAQIISSACGASQTCDMVVLTGGGPGVMEAANRGAEEVGAKSIGLNIVLPMEQSPNAFVTPELCFRFHYFALRKMHFLTRAKALIFFPGGYGTLDELFEAATLIQTGKIAPIPFLLFGQEYWERVINFETLISEGMISQADRDLMQFVETAEEAWHVIAARYNLATRVVSPKD